MATVIDSLIVTLGLDPKQYKKGTDEAKKSQKSFTEQTKRETKQQSELEKKAAEARMRRSKELHEQGKRTAETFRHIRNELLTTIGVFAGLGGMLAFSKDALVGAANLSLAAQTYGMSVRQVSGWQDAIKAMGGTKAEGSQLLSQANQSIAQLRMTGQQSPLLKAYQAYGGDLSHGELQSPQKLLMGIADLLHRYASQGPQGEREAANLAAQMGLSQSAFYLLRQGSGAAGGLVSKMASLAGVSERTAAAAQKLREQFVILKATMDKIATKLVLSLEPEFRKMLGVMERWANWISGHQAQINAFFHKLAVDLGDAAKITNTFVQHIGGWKVALEALIGLKVVKWLMPIVLGFSRMTGILPKLAGSMRGMGLLGLAGLDLFAWQQAYEGATTGSDSIYRGVNDLGSWLSGNRNFNLGGWLYNGTHLAPSLTNSNNTTSSHIGKITIYTKADNAKGIAMHIGSHLAHALPQADLGLQ